MNETTYHPTRRAVVQLAAASVVSAGL
ncbi:MAG: hypothetical protein ACI80K_003894, partial [Paracoccaceae bacterium]